MATLTRKYCHKRGEPVVPNCQACIMDPFFELFSGLGAMKNILAATVLMISAGTASAADMRAVPYTPYTKAPYVSPAYDWTGFYIGAMGGYGWSDEVRASIGGLTFSTSSSDAS